ncbi:MAG: hypothetical protein V7655_06525 [Aequorivita antarctica]
MKNANKFEPILLHTNENGITSAIKNAEGLASNWNNVLKEAEKLLKKKLTDEGKIEILEDRMDEVMAQLRSGFQFKNASDDFNIQSLGIDLTPIKEAFKRCKGKFDNNILEVKDGLVSISKEGRTQIENSGRVYTKSIRQNDVYQMAKKLSENLNEALEKKIIHKLDKPNLERTFRIITQPMGANGFAPDFEVISRI